MGYCRRPAKHLIVHNMPQKVTLVGDPILRAKAKQVHRDEIGSKKITDVIKKMSTVLRTTDDGIGIAAPQIGASLRIFLASEEALAIDRGETENAEKAEKKDWTYYVFINPEMVKKSGKKIKATEGCLSIPKKYGTVPRSEKIRVRALDEHGKRFERGASGLFARLLQHELDHLEGILYIDKADKVVSIP